MDKPTHNDGMTRRGILAAAAAVTVATAQTQNTQQIHSPDHHLPNETAPGPKNPTLEAQNPDSNWSPDTDNGTVPPFK